MKTNFDLRTVILHRMKLQFVHSPILLILALALTACDENKEQLHDTIKELKSQPATRQLGFQLNRFQRGETGINAYFNNKTALNLATELGEYETVALLLKMGADLNLKDHSEEEATFPLWTALGKQNWEIVRLLLAAGADPNAKVEAGEEWTSVVSRVVESENNEIARLFFDKGASPEAYNSDGETPLMMFADNNNVQMTRYLLSKYGNTLLEGKAGQYALQNAITSYSFDVAGILLSQGADATLKDQEGNTLLHHLFKTGNIYMQANGKHQAQELIHQIDLLLQHGVDINAVNQDGLSALHYLGQKIRNAQNRDAVTQIALFMIKKGADLFAKTPNGVTASDMFLNFKDNDELIRLIETRMKERTQQKPVNSES